MYLFQCFHLPNTIEHGAVREYPYVNIRHNNVVEVTFLLIGEKQVWHPHPLSVS